MKCHFRYLENVTYLRYLENWDWTQSAVLLQYRSNDRELDIRITSLFSPPENLFYELWY